MFTGVFALRSPQLLCCGPDAVKEVMVKQFKNFGENDFNMIDNTADPIFGRNPFLLAGAEWKEKRGEITPALTSGRIRAVYPLVEDVCHRLVDYVKRQGTGVDIQLKELSAKYTTDVVSNCLYAVDAKSFTTENPVIREMGRRLMEFPPLFNMYVMAVAVVPMLKIIYKMRLVPLEIEQFFTKLMNDAMEIRKNSNSDRQDFLEYLVQLKEKKNLSNLDMAAHSVTFFLDGFETSSVFISFVLYELSVNKAIQDRLREEIAAVESSKGLTIDSVSDMPYLEQVCNGKSQVKFSKQHQPLQDISEALRLHPTLVILGKRCTEDTEIEISKDKKVTVEKGTPVIVPVLSIHTGEVIRLKER
jgi:cytochrome P450